MRVAHATRSFERGGVKERFTTLALAAAALALFYVFFIPKPASESQPLELPLSTEAGADGYQALWRWLQGQHIPVAALHEPYSRLTRSQSGFAARGNVLISALPQRLPARNDELKELDLWVGRGNTLLVAAALDDTPRWAFGADEGFLRILGRMTRLRFEAIGEESGVHPAESTADRVSGAVAALLDSQRFIIEPSGPHPLNVGIRGLLALSDFPASHWRAQPMDEEPLLDIGERAVPQAQGAAIRQPAIWLKRQGEGQIIVIGVASALSNAAIAERDNARLASNIVAWSRSPGGAVIFDDDHQGAVSYYDAKAFFRDPRLHRSILWILVLWLLFVMGSQRLRGAADNWNRAGITKFIGVTGGFFASSLTPSAAGAQLFRNFFNAVRRNLRLREDGAPLWDWLAADARVPGAMLAELKILYDRTQAGKSVDLIRLHNILSDLKGTVA
jgi:hypothetical protein